MASSSPVVAVPSIIFFAIFLTFLLAHPSVAIIYLPPGLGLYAGKSLINGINKAEVGERCNFVLSTNGFTTWTSNPEGKIKDKECQIIVQKDGNLVLYSGEGAQIWESNTHKSQSHLDLDSDGNLHIRDVVGNSVWTPLGE